MNTVLSPMEEQAPVPEAGPSGRAPWILGGMIVLSAAVRSILAVRHTSPTFFPDEYIYAAISRALGHGSLDVRGGLIHFPEVFEPLLAAPIWRVFSVATAYHGVQIENAVLMSFAALPVYWLARSLRLSEFYSLVCAAYALVLPELVRAAFISSDAVGYLLALATFALGTASLEDPSWRKQLWFLVLVTMTTLTRVEYFALAPAYVVAAVALDRRSFLRRHRVALLSLVPVATIGLLSILGFYHLSGSISWHRYLFWLAVQPLLLSIEMGVVVIPGALCGLVTGTFSAAPRRERAFSAFTLALLVLTLVEATKVATQTDRYTERYLFLLQPLLVVAFGLYVKNRRPRRELAWLVALALVVGAAREPLSQFLDAVNSEFVFALTGTQGIPLGAGIALTIAILATVAAAAAAVLAILRGNQGVWAAVAATFAVTLLISAVATRDDVVNSRAVRASARHDVTWIDDKAHGPVTLIETPVSTGRDVIYQLFWNPSISRELLLGTARTTDHAFKAFPLHIGPTGEMENVPGDFLFHRYGTTGVFAGATLLATYGPFELWRSSGHARVRAVIAGRYFDGWMGTFALAQAWPSRVKGPVSVTFHLSLPRTRAVPVTLALGSTDVTIRPGDATVAECQSAHGPLGVVLRALSGGSRLKDQVRAISVKLTHITVTDRTLTGRPDHSCRVIR